jgi:hypothetical protein
LLTSKTAFEKDLRENTESFVYSHDSEAKTIVRK